MLARSSALLASERSIAVSILVCVCVLVEEQVELMS
jgi:hypothetical protein